MTTTTKYTDPVTTAYWQRVEAMFTFCEGVPTEQLQAGSLGELVTEFEELLDLFHGYQGMTFERANRVLAPFKGGNDG